MTNDATPGSDVGTGPYPGTSATPQNTRATAVSPPDEQWREEGGTPVPPEFPGYELVGKLGQGGMGVVYHARHRESNREVAIKVIRGGGGASNRLRFLAEAEAVAAVNHPHVVRVLEVNPDPRCPFIAFEYLASGTLADRLRPRCAPDQSARLAPTATAELLSKLADGTAAAHAAAVVHRDIKPSNVMFDAAGEPKLTDFGIAKRAVSDLTLTGEVFGTPEYMSPEQARGETKFVGPQADVWALGVILYECLTGDRPFHADSVPGILKRVQEATPDRPRRLAPDTPRDLELICLKCLEKEPHHRYATAKELAEDLRRFLAGKGLASRPPGPVRQAARWARRNPVPAAVGLVLFLATLATAVSALVALDRERARSRESEARFDAERREYAATELLRAERRERVLDELASAGPGAFIRGRFRDAVDDFDRAEAGGRPLTPQMRLSRIRAVQAVGDDTRLRREFDGIDFGALPDGARGSFELWKAVSLFGTNNAEADRLLRSALARPLPPGDRAYAEGAIATSTPDAVERFRTAIRHDLLHQPARSAACSLLLLSGRLDEAIELAEESAVLFADAPEFPIVVAVATGLKGDDKRALDRLVRIKDKVPADTHDLLKTFVSALPAACRALRANAGYGPRRLDDAAAVGGLAFRVLAFRNPQQDVRSVQMFGSLPPVHRKTFAVYVDLFFAPLHKRHDGGAAALREQLAGATRAHPEGFLLFRQLLFETDDAHEARSGTPAEVDEQFRRFRVAIETGERAAASRAVFPVQDMSADLVCMLNGSLCNRTWFGDRVEPAMVQRTLEMIRARVARWEDVPAASVRSSVVGFCLREREYDLARTVLSLWEGKLPDDAEAHRWRAEVESAAGAYAAAARAAELFLERHPYDQQMKNLRAAALGRLVPLEIAPPPRSGR